MSKITKATLKAFIRKNAGNLMIKNESSFDGMQDMVVSCEDRGFRPATQRDAHTENTLGIDGVWLVGGSRNYFQAFEQDGMRGIHVSNCCGSFTLATPVQA